MHLNILYQDEHLVAIDKPAGLLVHRSPLSRDRVFALQTLRDQIGRHVFTVHRLDRATSGVLLFGLSAEAARRLVGEFERQAVTKQYLTVVRGWVDADGTIDHAVTDDACHGLAKTAVTQYRRLATVELPFAVDRYPTSRYSLVLVTPQTGRRQQIRKHFKHISHHVIGDTTHGNGRHNRFFREHFGLTHLLLRASRLTFHHPFHQNLVRVDAGPDADWQTIAEIFSSPVAAR